MSEKKISDIRVIAEKIEVVPGEGRGGVRLYVRSDDGYSKFRGVGYAMRGTYLLSESQELQAWKKAHDEQMQIRDHLVSCARNLGFVETALCGGVVALAAMIGAHAELTHSEVLILQKEKESLSRKVDELKKQLEMAAEGQGEDNAIHERVRHEAEVRWNNELERKNNMLRAVEGQKNALEARLERSVRDGQREHSRALDAKMLLQDTLVLGARLAKAFLAPDIVTTWQNLAAESG